MTSMVAVTKKEHGLPYYVAVGLSWGLLAFTLLLAGLVILLPAATGSTSYTILTSSMEPTLPPGTLVVVKPADPDDIRIGTVITYQVKSGEPEVVTHRVVQIQEPNLPDGERRFIAKGDANGVVDEEPVRSVQLRGAVWYSVPLLGWVNNVVNGGLRNAIVPIAALVLFGYAGWMLVAHHRERQRERSRNRAAAVGAMPLRSPSS